MVNIHSFSEFTAQVDRSFRDAYSAGLDDLMIAPDELTSAWESSESPAEYVEWIATKYALVKRADFTPAMALEVWRPRAKL